MSPQEIPPRMAEAWFSPHDDCPGRIINLFGEAHAHADVCVFTITDDRISDALLAAHARGVRIRIISDNDKAHDSGSDIERFASIGRRFTCTTSSRFSTAGYCCAAVSTGRAAPPGTTRRISW
jgi:phosphatidylserine/phosphatidylglycerophosphate/cardiolipin synthase-like enzyme